MDYYKSQENVEQYIKHSEGYDGKLLLDKLSSYLTPESKVLELGMGEGKDTIMLSKSCQVTGSDNSSIFIERFKADNPGIEALNLDAETLDTNQKFDCVYSNKVLIHLSRHACVNSIKRQQAILNPDGLVLHSFWYGDNTEEYGELVSVNYNEKLLADLFKNGWQVVEMKRYKEMEDDDSIYIICRKL